ncbi:flavodoxin [Sphaerisporangium corydalis]|uniref:Flavodoxin n=1 Tax=Sphaerisporangium corydalis TaxID=1441875 RepID=A0ABV9EDE9_9ACTN|nr:flavodoxin [Sphaerisporangium corydalis]
MGRTPRALDRRQVLRGALLLGGTVITATACGGRDRPAPTSAAEPASQPAGPPPSAAAARTVLLVCFSRSGENYHYGGRRTLKVGNTQVLAQMISRRLDCDTYRIRPADPYPGDYEQTVARNVQEQNTDARPAIAGALPDLGPYQVVLLAGPIWNVRAPMIMTTFTEQFDFTGKTIHPVTTYAMSGLGTTEADYAASCPGATLGEGLAVRGEQVTDAGPAIDTWARRTGLPRA